MMNTYDIRIVHKYNVCVCVYICAYIYMYMQYIPHIYICRYMQTAFFQIAFSSLYKNLHIQDDAKIVILFDF